MSRPIASSCFITLIALCIATFWAGFAVAEEKADKSLRYFIGTYTGQGENDSKGIYTTVFDHEAGTFSPPELALECEQPSWIATHPTLPLLYAVSEKDRNAGLYVISYDAESGKMVLVERKDVPGKAPCHLAVLMLHDKPFAVATANYNSANVTEFEMQEEGRLKYARDHKFSAPSLRPGRNSQRQKESHPHGVFPIGKTGGHFYVPDLGGDFVYTFHYYKERGGNGSLLRTRGMELDLPPGTGPRHLAVSFLPQRDGPPVVHRVYVNGELNSTVNVFDLTNAYTEPVEIDLVQTISTLPEGFDPKNNSTAEIALSPNGKFLYISNRGHDSIAAFAVGEKDGKLTLVEHVPSGGKTPRFFMLDPTGQFLFSCNQSSGNIVVMKIDQETGKLTPTGSEIKVPQPVCMAAVPKP